MADTEARDMRRRDPKQFGSLAGVKVGQTWASRAELSREKVHPPPEGGIYGDKDGARSIVISGQYEDDEDQGETIIYTGHGGRDSKGVQVADQEFLDSGNAALKLNAGSGDVVRVFRGSELNTQWAPEEGFQYSGLYEVVKAEYTKGRQGFRVCRFELKRCLGQDPLPLRDAQQQIG